MAHHQTNVPNRRTETSPAPQAQRQDWPSFGDLRREMDNLFEDFTRGWFGNVPASGDGFARMMRSVGLEPAVDVVESDGGYRITAELPGVDTKDLDVTVSGDVLTIRGEKSESHEEKDKDRFLSERRYGAFQRSFRLPAGIDADRIEASHANGVLTLNVPKSAEAEAAKKKIEVKAD